MTQRTRYFLLGSALVVVLGVGTGLVAYYNGALSGLSAADDAELAYVPGDSTALAYADVRAIMSSDFRQKLREVMPTGDEKDRIHKEIGVDLEHDIDVVVAGFTGSDPTNGSAVVLVRGRFNDGQIETTAVQHGAKVEEYKGKRLLSWNYGGGAVEPTDGHAMSAGMNGPPVVAFLEPGLLALGPSASVRRAIDTAAAKSDITKNAELMKLVNDVRGGANAWVVGRFEEFTKSASLPDEVKAHLPAVQFLAVSAHVNGGLSGTIRAETRDEQAAKDLRAVVSGALAAGRLLAGQDQRATTVLNALQVGGTNKTVTLGFAVPPEVLDVLSGIARGQMHGAPERKQRPR
jgi:hypothetical protein